MEIRDLIAWIAAGLSLVAAFSYLVADIRQRRIVLMGTANLWAVIFLALVLIATGCAPSLPADIAREQIPHPQEVAPNHDGRPDQRNASHTTHKPPPLAQRITEGVVGQVFVNNNTTDVYLIGVPSGAIIHASIGYEPSLWGMVPAERLRWASRKATPAEAANFCTQALRTGRNTWYCGAELFWPRIRERVTWKSDGTGSVLLRRFTGAPYAEGPISFSVVRQEPTPPEVQE